MVKATIPIRLEVSVHAEYDEPGDDEAPAAALEDLTLTLSTAVVEFIEGLRRRGVTLSGSIEVGGRREEF